MVLGRQSDLRSCLTGGGHVTEGAVLNNGPIEGFQLASLMAQSASLPVGITGLCPCPTPQAVNVNRFTAASSRCWHRWQILLKIYSPFESSEMAGPLTWAYAKPTRGWFVTGSSPPPSPIHVIALPVIKVDGLRKRATGLARWCVTAVHLPSQGPRSATRREIETLRVTSGVVSPMLS